MVNSDSREVRKAVFRARRSAQCSGQTNRCRPPRSAQSHDIDRANVTPIRTPSAQRMRGKEGLNDSRPSHRFLRHAGRHWRQLSPSPQEAVKALSRKHRIQRSCERKTGIMLLSSFGSWGKRGRERGVRIPRCSHKQRGMGLVRVVAANRKANKRSATWAQLLSKKRRARSGGEEHDRIYKPSWIACHYPHPPHSSRRERTITASPELVHFALLRRRARRIRRLANIRHGRQRERRRHCRR
jgi:hypothetical protein